jgi:hypothetical protein
MAWRVDSGLPPVATPTFAPSEGTYGTPQSVTLSTTTAGASIRYTTNGTAPTATSGTLYSGPITVSSDTVIKAIAFKSGAADSAVATATYTISSSPPAATPTFNPAPGTYSTAQSVALSSSTAGVSIRYTTDGSTPTAANGTIYSGPITVDVSETVKAVAFGGGFSDSAVATGSYVINGGPPITRTFEAETTGHTTTGATSTIQNDANTSGGHWVSLDADGVGDFIEFLIGTGGGSSDPQIQAGTYTVGLSYKTNNNRGILSLSIDGVAIGGTLDQYATSSTYPTRNFGTVTFASTDNHIIRLTVTGKNASSSGFVLSADKVTFTPVAAPTPHFEAESLARTSAGATTTVQNDANTSGGHWISLDANSVGDSVDFTLPSVPAGTYSVQMKYKTNNNRGILSLAIDGTTLSGTVDQYAATSTYPTHTFGTVTFNSAGNHTVRLTATGKNTASSNFTLSADAFDLVPAPQ